MGRPGSSGGIHYLKGFDQVMGNLNKEIAALKVNSEAGLVKAVAFIRHETEHTPPKTPRDLGNLVHSWFVVSAKTTYAGNVSGGFKGKNASKFAADHGSALSDFKSYAQGLDSGGRKFLVFGYSVNYSGFIHEMIVAQNFTRAGSNIRWLEHHIKKNRATMLAIIQKQVKIKP